MNGWHSIMRPSGRTCLGPRLLSRPRTSLPGSPGRDLPWNSESEPAASPSLSAGGVRVCGIELSAAMATQLQSHQQASDIEVTIGDFATTTVDWRFRLVYLLRNTITNLTTQDEQVQAGQLAGIHSDPLDDRSDRTPSPP